MGDTQHAHVRFDIIFFLIFSVLLGVPQLAAAAANDVTTSSQKDIALTFDDGPYGTSTEIVLSILKKEKIPATFFLIGKNVEEYPSLAKEIATDGFSIGNHSYDHSASLWKLSSSTFATNLDLAENIIASTTGVRATFFRPPYGRMSTTMHRVLYKKGYRIAMWNVDPNDWNQHVSSEGIIKSVLTQTKQNGIILLHDGRDIHVGYPRENMIHALPELITDLQTEGYTFVTLDALLK